MNEKKERKKYLRKSNIYKLLLNIIKPLMLCPSNMRVISSKHSLTLFLQYSLQMIMVVVVVVMMMMMGLIDEEKKSDNDDYDDDDYNDDDDDDLSQNFSSLSTFGPESKRRL